MSLLVNYESSGITSFTVTGMECRDFLIALYKIWLNSPMTDEKEHILIREAMRDPVFLKLLNKV